MWAVTQSDWDPSPAIFTQVRLGPCAAFRAPGKITRERIFTCRATHLRFSVLYFKDVLNILTSYYPLQTAII